MAEAVSRFGAIGTTLTHISSSTFGGTGSQRRDMARRVERAFDPWRNASAATRASLGLTVATKALTVTDYATSVFAPGLEGDVRGAVSGAVQIAVAPTIITAGTAVFGTLGTGAGALVGSVIPVVGTGLGGVVGGAIGKVAGGYLSAFAYDKWIKGWVGAGVEAGLAGLFDKGALQDAMRNRDQYFYDQSIPEMRVAWDELRSTGLGPDSVELTGPEQTPYIVVPAEPDAVVLTLPESFAVSWDTDPGNWVPCTIAGGNVTCLDERDIAGGHMKSTSTGTVTGNVIELESLTIWQTGGECPTTTKYLAHNTMVFEPGGRLTTSGGGTGEIIARSGPCTGGETSWTYSGDAEGSWRPN
ncbi:MAG: hypothetical protein Q7T08_08390, partial [Devosia sp.]|nr:hypothetical protein [Devosia sp.]